MNENLNLVEILKDCPKGTKLYSPIYGDVELVNISQDNVPYPIVTKTNSNLTGMFSTVSFIKDGRIFSEYKGECLLFPSREQRDWSKFKVKKPRFDPNTLKPFDKVLVREGFEWHCNLFSHRLYDGYAHIDGCAYNYCIPYNEDTKHLVGTADEAPDYYRYWEE